MTDTTDRRAELRYQACRQLTEAREAHRQLIRLARAAGTLYGGPLGEVLRLAAEASAEAYEAAHEALVELVERHLVEQILPGPTLDEYPTVLWTLACTGCRRAIELPTTSVDLGELGIRDLQGWTLQPTRCPPCAVEDHLLQRRDHVCTDPACTICEPF